MFSLETRTGTTASAHSSAEAAPTEAASASETASAKAADKWTASATSPVMVVIIITLLATYDGMSAVSTCIGDIFGLHSINPGYRVDALYFLLSYNLYFIFILLTISVLSIVYVDYFPYLYKIL